MLRIQNLSKRYKNAPVPALDDVSFNIEKGEFVGLLGPNGAGKTTLINLVAGIAARDSGRIAIAGHDFDSGHIALKTSIGFVPQEVTFDYLFTVRESLELQSGYYGLRANGGYIDYIMKRLSLYSKKNSPVRNLSGGMKRRLLIAKALVHRPDILILDEPTAGVDINLRRELYDFVRELNAGGVTILLTTHYLEEAEELCRRIILINGGRVVVDKSKDDFLRMAGDFLTLQVKASADIGARFSDFSGLTQSENMLTLEFSKHRLGEVMRILSECENKIDDISISSPGVEELFMRLTSGGAA